MAKIRTEQQHRAAIDALLPRAEAALTGPSFGGPSCATPTPPRSAPLRLAGRYRPCRRGPVPSPWPAQPATGRHATHDLTHGRTHRPDPRRSPSPSLRPKEPRAHEPAAPYSCSYTPTAKTTCSPTRRTFGHGWKPTAAAHSIRPIDRREPLCVDLTERAYDPSAVGVDPVSRTDCPSDGVHSTSCRGEVETWLRGGLAAS
jgi:hypothetical protein